MERLEHDLAEYHVLVFRGHSAPSDAELVRFVGSFGELERPDVVPDQVNLDTPQIVCISNEVANGAYVGPSQTTRSLDGHSDYCWRTGCLASARLTQLRYRTRAARHGFRTCMPYSIPWSQFWVNGSKD
jgi:alpha-ketoglutarate-dependent taurine dioxygenase